MWNLKKDKLIETENWLLPEAGGEGIGKMDEGVQKVQVSSYKTHKFWDVMYSIVTIAINTLFLFEIFCIFESC